MKKNTLTKFTKTLSRILEVILFIAAILCLVGALASGIALSPSIISKTMELVQNGQLTLTTDIFTKMDTFAEIRTGAVLACLNGFVVTVLGALIFRNISRVFKNTETTNTPFTQENVKLVRNIGFYAIVTPFVAVVFDVLTGIFCHISMTASIDVTTLVMGLIVLCLASFFEYGVTLEDEVEGMI